MRSRKIRDDELVAMYRAGTPQKDIAVTMGVSEPAISKRLKRLMPPPELSHLTDKQKVFAIEVAKGHSPTQAALMAYDCKNRNTAKVIGSQQLNNPEVREAIADLMDSVGFTRRFKVQRLMHFAGHADGNVALKAIDMGLKLRDEYPRKGEHVVDYKFTQINLSALRLDRTSEQAPATDGSVDLDQYFREAAGEDNP